MPLVDSARSGVLALHAQADLAAADRGQRSADERVSDPPSALVGGNEKIDDEGQTFDVVPRRLVGHQDGADRLPALLCDQARIGDPRAVLAGARSFDVGDGLFARPDLAVGI